MKVEPKRVTCGRCGKEYTLLMVTKDGEALQSNTTCTRCHHELADAFNKAMFDEKVEKFKEVRKELGL